MWKIILQYDAKRGKRKKIFRLLFKDREDKFVKEMKRLRSLGLIGGIQRIAL